MKNIYVILIVSLMGLFSCTNNTTKKTNNESQETNLGQEEGEENEEGVVILSKKQQEALHLKLGSITKRNLTTVVKINGELSVSPSSIANITAIVGGNVKSIEVFQGDKVKKGQTLVILQHPDYITLQEDFAVIAQNLEFLEKEYNRKKELFEQNVGAQKDYQKAKADYFISKAKYEGLKSRLELLNLSPKSVKQGKISNTIRLLSPINGYVNEVNINVGSYVDAKDIIMEISDNSDLHADFNVYEKDVHLLKKGQKIHLTIANNPDNEYTATVFAIGKEFAKNSRTISIHARLNGSNEGLIPGMYITGHLHADEKLTDALPNDAIVNKGTKSFIFVVDNEHDDNTENEDDQNSTEYRILEVIRGSSDGGYTEVSVVDDMPKDSKVVLNVAYYLLSEMNKEETGDDD